MKKFIIILIFISLFSPLFSYSLKFSGGIRIDAEPEVEAVGAFSYKEGNLSLGINKLGKDILQFESSYISNINKHFIYKGSLDFEMIKSDAFFFISDHSFYSPWGKNVFFTFGFGAQIGLAYLNLVKRPMISLTPLIYLDFGYKNKIMNASIYLDLNQRFEKTWKALPTVGIKGTWYINEKNSIELDAWFKSSEYLMDPWYLPESGGVTLSYTRSDL